MEESVPVMVKIFPSVPTTKDCPPPTAHWILPVPSPGISNEIAFESMTSLISSASVGENFS